jgi:RNA polymerase sigma-70 factor (ECF subfamily)
VGTARALSKPVVASGHMTITAIREHCELVHDRAYHLCRGHLDHEDLAQDVIERWLRRMPSLPPETNHAAWLTTVLKNLFVDRLRRRGARPELATDCSRLPEIAREARPWWRELGAGEIDQALAELPSRQRATFRMFAFEGKSYDEIARRQGIARSTVGTRILRARARIKALLEARSPARGRPATAS